MATNENSLQLKRRTNEWISDNYENSVFGGTAEVEPLRV